MPDLRGEVGTDHLVTTMQRDAIVLTGVGMHTSLGGVVQAAAAFRCGVSRTRELVNCPYFDEFNNDLHYVVGHSAGGVTEGFQRGGRLIRLGVAALKDLSREVAWETIDVARLGIFLAFTDQSNAMEIGDEPGLYLERLWGYSGLEVQRHHVHTYMDGELGLYLALDEALQHLEKNSLDACLVGAIDTLIDANRLFAYRSEDRLKAVDNPVGLVPGEAACFMLIERLDRARRRKATPLAVLHRPCFAVPDQGTDEQAVNQGAAMSKAIAGALRHAGAPQDGPLTIYWDANGEQDKALDLGYALLRLREAYDVEVWTQAFPAANFGDTGTAGGMLALCLAVRAFQRRYNAGSRAVVALSSDGAYRIAFCVEQADASP